VLRARAAVIEFDADGSVLHAWGGPGQGYEWFENEHASPSDRRQLWVAQRSQGPPAPQFHARGKFLMQIGKQARPRQQTPPRCSPPAHMEIDAGANELYVADGYGNKRVIVSTRPPAPTSATGARTATCRATTSFP